VRCVVAAVVLGCGGQTVSGTPDAEQSSGGSKASTVQVASTGGSAAGGAAGGTGGQLSATGGQSGFDRCGDGQVQSPEECDDGNDVAGDGCTACRIEIPDPCPIGCTRTIVCGDGRRDTGEACDDGNITSGDGCPNDCSYVEPGWICSVPGQACRKLSPYCGNGVIEPEWGEACDEGPFNGQPGHCTTGCQIVHCGDAVVQPALGETCDDGVNDGAYGGCTADCQRGPYCGDGVLQSWGGEVCDLGNANELVPSYGGCSSECQLGPHCGDGIVQLPDEQCDDGNHLCCDGCGAACLIEIPVL
jgi:cysteine-rich repeat protein